MAYTYHAMRAFQSKNARETKEHAITNGEVEQESCGRSRTFSISVCKMIDIYGALGIRVFCLSKHEVCHDKTSLVMDLQSLRPCFDCGFTA